MKNTALLRLVASMAIFGTIGLAVVNLPLPRGFIAMTRGAIGALALLLILLISGKRFSFSAIKKNARLLLISGAFIGVNWILLFEAYSYTSVSVATLVYYMAPLIVTVISATVLGERLRIKSCICIAVALFGMLLVSGVLDGGIEDVRETVGIALSFGAAILYALATVLNKKIKDVPAYDTSIVQLSVAFMAILPYTLLCEDVWGLEWSFQTVALLLLVGLVHTGLAYALFFSSVKNLKGQTVALFSYVDPCLSVLLSILFLGDEPTPTLITGAVLIIGALVAAELRLPKRCEG
ncbi:MAG: DMT family transporter [Ruminococcaceae bacterium]|nr:DMT family transporter [Oscillospiraceae bacterium]